MALTNPTTTLDKYRRDWMICKRINTWLTDDYTDYDTPQFDNPPNNNTNYNCDTSMSYSPAIEKRFRFPQIKRSTNDHRVPLSTMQRYFQCIKELIHLMGYHYKCTLLLPTVIYADRYVEKCGLLQNSADLFRLLLVAAMEAVKMWYASLSLSLPLSFIVVHQ